MNRLVRKYTLLAAMGGVASLLAISSRAQNTASAPDPFAADKVKGPVKLAPGEPKSGIYLGAALDSSTLKAGNVTGQISAQIRDFERSAGRPHALYLQFLQFPNEQGEFGTWDKDPNGWASAAQFVQGIGATGAVPVLTLEPMKPHMFLDWREGSKAYNATRAFAQQAGKWGKPLFIRFAHEMNGSWYPWAEWADLNRNMQRDPGEDTGFTAAHYRQAYRNMASMFRRYAPNAALVWCPNSGLLGGTRRDVFRPFYPGDDVVDWVGLDIYERGWKMPAPGVRLWGGQFAHNLTHDMTDDPDTPQNESVNFYLVYGEWKKKPVMICETGATLSYRTDLPPAERAVLNRDWKIGYWNSNEYGWLRNVYGTSAITDQKFLQPVDKVFPQVKAIVWFNIAKREYIPAQRPDGTYAWYDNEWADYRIGGGVEEGKASPFANQEIALYKKLTRPSYFLSRVSSPATPVASPARAAAPKANTASGGKVKSAPIPARKKTPVGKNSTRQPVKRT